MREAQPTPDAERIEEFQFVQIKLGGRWTPALVDAWIRGENGWIGHVKWPKHKAVNGRVTGAEYMAYDPATIRRLTSADLKQDDPP